MSKDQYFGSWYLSLWRKNSHDSKFLRKFYTHLPFYRVLFTLYLKNLQGDSWGKGNILGVDIICHCGGKSHMTPSSSENLTPTYHSTGCCLYSILKIYRVFHEERAIFWELILSVIVEEKVTWLQVPPKIWHPPTILQGVVCTLS